MDEDLGVSNERGSGREEGEERVGEGEKGAGGEGKEKRWEGGREEEIARGRGGGGCLARSGIVWPFLRQTYV